MTTAVDKVIVHAEGSVLHGYTDRSAWIPNPALLLSDSPEIFFIGEDTPRRINLSALKCIRFVSSFESQSDRPIQFYDGLPISQALWIRVLIRGEGWVEGFAKNSSDLLRSSLLPVFVLESGASGGLTIFPCSQIEEFFVLGLREVPSAAMII